MTEPAPVEAQIRQIIRDAVRARTVGRDAEYAALVERVRELAAQWHGAPPSSALPKETIND